MCGFFFLNTYICEIKNKNHFSFEPFANSPTRMQRLNSQTSSRGCCMLSPVKTYAIFLTISLSACSLSGLELTDKPVAENDVFNFLRFLQAVFMKGV